MVEVMSFMLMKTYTLGNSKMGSQMGWENTLGRKVKNMRVNGFKVQNMDREHGREEVVMCIRGNGKNQKLTDTGLIYG
jgi:hypothetical protein